MFSFFDCPTLQDVEHAPVGMAAYVLEKCKKLSTECHKYLQNLQNTFKSELKQKYS